jgi:hypothetical protein
MMALWQRTQLVFGRGALGKNSRENFQRLQVLLIKSLTVVYAKLS